VLVLTSRRLFIDVIPDLGALPFHQLRLRRAAPDRGARSAAAEALFAHLARHAGVRGCVGAQSLAATSRARTARPGGIQMESWRMTSLYSLYCKALPGRHPVPFAPPCTTKVRVLSTCSPRPIRWLAFWPSLAWSRPLARARQQLFVVLCRLWSCDEGLSFKPLLQSGPRGAWQGTIRLCGFAPCPARLARLPPCRPSLLLVSSAALLSWRWAGFLTGRSWERRPRGYAPDLAPAFAPYRRAAPAPGIDESLPLSSTGCQRLARMAWRAALLVIPSRIKTPSGRSGQGARRSLVSLLPAHHVGSLFVTFLLLFSDGLCIWALRALFIADVGCWGAGARGPPFVPGVRWCS